MATRDLFAPQSEDIIREAFIRMKKLAEQRYQDETERAIDYLENRQVEDTRGELMVRYQKTQQTTAGQDIQPFTVPLTSRYVSEAASAYNHPLARKIVGVANGETDDDLTKAVNDFLAECDFDERCHKIEQVMALVKSCGMWFQVKRGMLRPVPTFPHKIHVVTPSNPVMFDAADAEDYLGFIIQLAYGLQDDRAEPAHFAFLTHAETMYYTTSDGNPYSEPRNPQVFKNPFAWQQKFDTPDGRGGEAILPLQPLTVWNRELPVDCLIHECDSDIVNANREINVALSMLIDAIRTQSWAVGVLKLLNPEQAPAKMAWGPRFPVTVMPGEDFQMLHAPTPYAEIVSALNEIVKMLAIAHRQSAHDFSTEQSRAMSGFAKLVDSLPKIEARAEHTTRLKRIEEKDAWPRIAAAMIFLGRLPASVMTTHKMLVDFEPLAFPKDVQEEVQGNQADIDMNLTTPAKILAKRKGITLEQAAKEITENKTDNKVQLPEPLPPVPTPFASGGKPGAGGGTSGGNSGGIGGSVGRKSSKF